MVLGELKFEAEMQKVSAFGGFGLRVLVDRGLGAARSSF